MAWVQSASTRFAARHDARDDADTAQVLRQLDESVAGFERTLGVHAGDLTLVLHATEAALDAAAPGVTVLRRAAAPAARRYVVGWPGTDELHVLAPRALARRATNAKGSLELLMLAPTALLARRLLAAALSGMPPPWTARSWRRYMRWAWLLEGAAQWLAGGVDYTRPLVARRLRDHPPPTLPPARCDALALGGTVFDHLAREAGSAAALRLALDAPSIGIEPVLEHAFGGRDIRHTEAAWRAYLARLSPGMSGPHTVPRNQLAPAATRPQSRSRGSAEPRPAEPRPRARDRF